MSQADDAPPGIPMPRVAAAAALLGGIIAQRIAAIPKERTPEGRRAKAAAKDAALLERCARVTPHPASLWAPTIDAFVAWLRSDPTDVRPGVDAAVRDGDNDDDDDDDSGQDQDDDDDVIRLLIRNDRRGQPDHCNSAASTAANFLRPLERMGVDVYAITTHPENAHLIGCCTTTPPLIEADCGYGDWRFVAIMERDVDCVGGMILIERVVHAPTGAGIDVHCDLRCQNTSRGTRALLFSFLRSGETSLPAFLHATFASFDRVIDVLHAHGWDTRGERLSWSHVDRALYDQRIACTRADGTTVHLLWRHGTLVASNCEYGPSLDMHYPPASTYGPDPGREAPPQEGDDDDDSDHEEEEDDDGGDGASLRDDRAWLIEQGHVAPWVLTARSNGRSGNCPALLIKTFGDDTTDVDIVSRMDAVADQIARSQGLDGGTTAARAYGSHYLNGWTCEAALRNVLNLGARTWRLAMRDRSIVSGERCIDPQRGLYANWIITCDMLPVGNRLDGSVRTTGLPFVRFHGHMLGIDGRGGSTATQAAHVVVVLCEPMQSRFPSQQPSVPADGEGSRVAAMIQALRDYERQTAAYRADATPTPLHPIAAYYRQRCVESRHGPKVMTVLHEASSVPCDSDRDPSTGFVGALEWLVSEFEYCARLFAADAAFATDLDSDSDRWTLELD